jgi:hypothetical protein
VDLRAGSPADPRGPDHLVTGPECRRFPIAAGYGAVSPDDQALHQAVCAEIEGGTGNEMLTRVKLADCGTSPAGQLLADLAAALGSAAAATPDEGCVFVFAEQDPAGSPAGPPHGSFPRPGTASPGNPVALTRSPLAPPARAR